MVTPQSKRIYAVTIFLLLIISYLYITPKDNWNSFSRVSLVRAIVENGVVNIDEFHESTGDKAYFEGHYYSHSSIGPSIIAIPSYFIMYHIASVSPFNNIISNYQGIATKLSSAVSATLPSAILGTILFLFLSRFTTKPFYAAVVTLAYGLGTIAFPYSTIMFQHQLAAAGLFIGFFLLWRIAVERANNRWLWVVGFILGFTFITDYITIILMGMIGLWFLYKTHNFRSIVPITIGALPALLIFFAYNQAAFGSPLSIGYMHTIWDPVTSQGFMGLSFPTIEGLWGITFSSFRGLFFISPFLILGFVGLYLMFRHKINHGLVVLFSAIIVTGFLYNASFVTWWAGWSIGPRYVAPIIPFLAVPVIFAVEVLVKRKWGVALLTILLVTSVANVWIQTYGSNMIVPDTLDQPPDYDDYAAWLLEKAETGQLEYNPLFNFSIPALLSGDMSSTWVSKAVGQTGILITFVPLFTLWGIIIFIMKRMLQRHRSGS